MFYNLNTNSFSAVKRELTDIELSQELVDNMFAIAQKQDKVIATKNGQPTIMTITEFEVLRNGN